MDTIGSRLRQQRERLRLNQEQIAAIGGVQRRAQVNYEADVREPSAGYLAAVAREGVDVLYVLTGLRSVAIAHMSESMRERYNRLVDDFTALPDDLQIVACDYVGGLALRALREDRSPLLKRRSIPVDVAQAILDARTDVSGSVRALPSDSARPQSVGRGTDGGASALNEPRRTYKKKEA